MVDAINPHALRLRLSDECRSRQRTIARENAFCTDTRSHRRSGEFKENLMQSCYYISATGLPAISVPGGFTPDGLPIGLQIVGRHQQDFRVLQLAHAFEQATGYWKTRPPLTA